MAMVAARGCKVLRKNGFFTVSQDFCFYFGTYRIKIISAMSQLLEKAAGKRKPTETTKVETTAKMESYLDQVILPSIYTIFSCPTILTVFHLSKQELHF